MNGLQLARKGNNIQQLNRIALGYGGFAVRPVPIRNGGRMCFHRGMKRLFLGFSVGLQMLAQVSGLSLPPSGRNQ